MTYINYKKIYQRKSNRKAPTFGIFACKMCKIDFEKKAWNNNYCNNCIIIRGREKGQKAFYSGRKRSCEICKTEFIRASHRSNKFCSRKCMATNYSKKRQGKENPAYRNGTRTGGRRLDYQQQVFVKQAKILKQVILEKDGYLHCELCLTTNSLRFETHHLCFRSEFPRHENLHDLRNLIYLCIKCHNWFHTQKDRRQPLIEERKLWELFPTLKN